MAFKCASCSAMCIECWLLTSSTKLLISPKVSAGSAVSGMVNLAGSEKCYGNESCIKRTVVVLFGTKRA